MTWHYALAVYWVFGVISVTITIVKEQNFRLRDLLGTMLVFWIFWPMIFGVTACELLCELDVDGILDTVLIKRWETK